MIKKLLQKVLSPLGLLRTPYGVSLIEEQRVRFMCDLLYKLIEKNIKGDIIEFGVFRGGSLMKLGRTSISTNKVVYGLDTFTGHPYPDKTTNKKRIIKNTKFGIIQTIINRKGLYNIKMLQGKFINTMPLLKYKRFCFAHVDCNDYLSHEQALKFVLSRMVKRGIIYFDDYNNPTCPDVNKVVHKFIKKKDLVILPDKQAYYIIK